MSTTVPIDLTGIGPWGVSRYMRLPCKEIQRTSPSGRLMRCMLLHLPLVPGVDGCFGAGNRRNAIWPVIQEDRLRVGHLSARGQPKNGAQLRREARPITLKVSLEDADASDLGCQTQELVTLVRPPYLVRVPAGRAASDSRCQGPGFDLIQREYEHMHLMQTDVNCEPASRILCLALIGLNQSSTN